MADAGAAPEALDAPDDDADELAGTVVFCTDGALVAGALVGGTLVGGAEVGGTLVGGAVVGGTEVGGTEVGGTAVGGTGVDVAAGALVALGAAVGAA